MLLTRVLFVPITLAVLVPFKAQAQSPSVEDVSRLVEQLTSQVEAAEALPFGDGTEGAAQAELADLAATLQSQEAMIAARQAEIAASVSEIIAVLPQFPEAPAPSPPVPTPSPPTIKPSPMDPGPQVGFDPNGPAPGPQIAQLPNLSDLKSPLAYGERARRVLTRPDAQMRDAAGNLTPLPSFSVLYVYAEAEAESTPLLAVGWGTRGAEGWVQASQTEDWRTMLVMSYAPNTGRDRTVFFKSKDDVFDIIDLEENSADAIQTIHDQIEDGTHDPEKIVAIEPALTVDSVERPYLMPVLDFVQTSTETHGDVTILQLAALNRDSTDSARVGQQPLGQDRMSVEADGRDFRVGVAFVIDTTRSMGPYIDRTKGFVRDISQGLSDRGLQDQFDFALVGFRDNTDAAAQDIGYLRTIYRDFGRPVESPTLLSTVEEMRPAQASTVNWKEDAFAGIDLAIGGLSWSEVDTRLVFLITDASPRSVGDVLALDSRMGPETINALAKQRNISLFVLHMQTEEAATVSQKNEGYDDTARGQQLYARMSQTGDSAIAKYFSVQGRTAQSFAESMQLVAGLVIDQLSQIANGGQVTQPDDFLEDPFMSAITAGKPVVINDEGGASQVAAAVAGELFRYQTEYLGARSGVEAPDFYRGWAVDKDIANPSRRSLEVSVFVTRDQLSDLANRLGDIVTRLREKDLGMGGFFSSVQAQAGSTVVDPTFGSFLPSYLDDLPYGSKFINMTATTWDALGQTSREQLLDEVEAKLASYTRIYSTEDGWITLDDRSVENQVYPLPLRDLP